MGAKNDKTDKPQILIVGNPAHQIFLQRHHEAKSGGYERYPESYKDKLDENKTEAAESSINTLTRTILEALDDYPEEPYEKAKPEDYTRKYKKHIAELKKRTGIRFVFKIQQKLGNVKTRSELTSILEFFPPKSPPNDRDVKVLRVKERYYNTHKEEKPRSFISEDRFTDSALSSNILVFYDRCSTLRNAIRTDKGKGVEVKPTLKELGNAARGGVIIAIRDELEDTKGSPKWLEELKDQLQEKGDGLKKRTLVMVTADALRKYGLKITELGSLEQAVQDVVRYSTQSPINTLLEIGDHLVVVFRETGALYLNRENDSGSIHFCPNFDRNAQVDTETFGIMPGKFTIMLAAIVRALYAKCKKTDGDNEKIDDDKWDIAGALQLGVAAFNIYFREGYEKDPEYEIKNPFDALEKSLSIKRREVIKKETLDLKRPSLLLTSLEINNWVKSDKKEWKWRRVDSYLSSEAARAKKSRADVENETVFGIVKSGLEKTFCSMTEKDANDKKNIKDSYKSEWMPPPVINCPYAEFGMIKTFDAEEIESFLSLGRLIRKYIKDKQLDKPLSIAVFGAPGAGKGFSVNQILESVCPGKKTRSLTFNLAQINSVEQLTDAFHQVQDLALSAEDEVPLVIFDEFDAFFETQLGWLKFFLAPMQDGLFRGRGGTYRVGRAIFLFAGGTCDNFKEFKDQTFIFRKQQKQISDNTGNTSTDENDVSTPMPAVPPPITGNTSTDENDVSTDENDVSRRRAKLGDFISRLRGYLNVQDINPKLKEGKKEYEELDFPLKLRRAVILRSLLERFAKPIFHPERTGSVEVASIDDQVISKLLNAKKYKHGVRSMEAVVQMSRWIEGEFVPASLPADDQFELHIELGDTQEKPVKA